MFYSASNGGTGPASHITRLYIRIKFLLCEFLFVNTYILARLKFHITVKKRIWKFVPFNWRLNQLHYLYKFYAEGLQEILIDL
jgi:hypothetical protein